ncbi:MAG: methylated-DNA--[protein]-cysteine S-methyltransferase [Alphaproteobacteria bacterium]|nr:methylated-DNA--[protein]-cysteine S-methyltransferase [Alphaproteobacteria bacterium]
MPHLTLASPLGPLLLTEEEGRLVSLGWGEGGGDLTPLLVEARRQLDLYFAGRLTAFDLPLAPSGTPFQKRVWEALLAIPYGAVRHYSDIARTAGGVARAVGGACGANPLAIVIPCHRVVGSAGLTGFSGGAGIDTKQALIDLERGQKRLEL